MRLLMVVLATAFNAASASAEPVYTVIKVLDGDTLRTLEHGAVRFAVTAAPEIGWRARCPAEEARGLRARDYVRARLAGRVILRTEPGERDRDHHGRLLRRVFAADGGDVEAELVALGLAVRFRHRAPAHDWCRPQ